MTDTPTDRASGVLPLEDTTVVDLTQVLAGPFATMNLGDLGAEVIKIEAVGRGDRARGFGPVPEYYDTVNRNKRSVELDLKSEHGREVALDLLAEADVLVESTKPGRIEDFGLGYGSVREVSPDIVYCTITGFGEGSPYEGVPAWDMLVQAMSGIMSTTGTDGTPPLWSGLASGDLAAGTYATQSVLAALFARERGAIDSEWIEVPMLDAAVSWLSVRAGPTFGTGEPFPRFGTTHPSIAPFGVFECRDDAVVIAAGTPSLWRDLCTALDREELLEDGRFETMEDRVENRAAMRAELGETLGARSSEAVVSTLQADGVPAGPIHDTASVWDDPHVRERGLRRRMDREGRQDAEVIDHPVHYTELLATLRRAPEELGESTDDVLAAHGYSEGEIEALREDDVIG
ncbi:formyl-CoA transferase [Halobacteriales archaeon QS_5_70_15]|nr:MAG: formyl-CoA transferase [Halobacteriales archaeon QS_5_70_15]